IRQDVAATRRRARSSKEGAMFQRTLLFAICCLGALTASASADVITDWNEKAIALVMKHRMLPPQAERVIDGMHVAMFDAVNSLDQHYQPYGISVSAPKDASKEAAAAAAAGGVLAQLFPKDTDELRTAQLSHLTPIPEGAAKSAGIKVGEDSQN